MTSGTRSSDCHHIGRRLSMYLQHSDFQVSDTGKIRSLLADLAGSHVDMLVPLQDLVGRPAFAAMINSLGADNKASLLQVQRQSQALLNDISNTFTPVIVSGLSDVLSGFLEHAFTLTSSQISLRPELVNLPLAATAFPDSRAALPPESAKPDRFLANPSIPDVLPHVSQNRHASSGIQSLRFLMLILGFLLGAASLTAAVVIIFRNPQYCEALSLCQTQRVSPETIQALYSAQKSYQDLIDAKDLNSYRRAYALLERESLRLSGDKLLPDQEQKYLQYRVVLVRAKEIIAEEERIQDQLNQVVLLLDRSRAADAGDQLFYLDQADRILSTISDKSFVVERVRELKSQISSLRTQFTSAPSPIQAPACMPANSPRCRLENKDRFPPLPPLPPTFNPP